MKCVEKTKRINDQVIGNQSQIESDFRFSQFSNFIVEIEFAEYKCLLSKFFIEFFFQNWFINQRWIRDQEIVVGWIRFELEKTTH